MKFPNKVGGGSRTNINGLHFEQTTSLEEVFNNHPDFIVSDNYIIRNGAIVGQFCGKNKIYKDLLEPKGVDIKNIISKKLLPDDALLIGDTVYIVEKKFQNSAGSVDEKLQTCDFKKKQYSKLLSTIGFQVQYYYVLNDWFKHPSYNDVHAYILSVGCKYFFNEIPLKEFGL